MIFWIWMQCDWNAYKSGNLITPDSGHCFKLSTKQTTMRWSYLAQRTSSHQLVRIGDHGIHQFVSLTWTRLNMVPPCFFTHRFIPLLHGILILTEDKGSLHFSHCIIASLSTTILAFPVSRQSLFQSGRVQDKDTWVWSHVTHSMLTDRNAAI